MKFVKICSTIREKFAPQKPTIWHNEQLNEGYTYSILGNSCIHDITSSVIEESLLHTIPLIVCAAMNTSIVVMHTCERPLASIGASLLTSNWINLAWPWLAAQSIGVHCLSFLHTIMNIHYNTLYSVSSTVLHHCDQLSISNLTMSLNMMSQYEIFNTNHPHSIILVWGMQLNVQLP